MATFTASYDRGGILGDATCIIQGKDSAWRLEGWQWRRFEQRLGRAYAELRDPAGALIRRKEINASQEAALTLGSQVSVEFTPDDHPTGQGDVMTPARFSIVNRYGKVLLNSELGRVVMLGPEQILTIGVELAGY